MGTRKHVLDGGQDRTNPSVAASGDKSAMRPFATWFRRDLLSVKFVVQMATADRPLVVLMDGLNLLSLDHRADRLNWLPTSLPTNVHLILSTTTDHPTFDALRTRTGWLLPESSVDSGDGVGCFVEVPPLSHDVSVGLVREWLRQSGRDLTNQQLQIVNDALKQCSLPLYTSLVFEEVSVVSSFR